MDQPLPVLQPQYNGWDPFTTNAAPLMLPNGEPPPPLRLHELC